MTRERVFRMLVIGLAFVCGSYLLCIEIYITGAALYIWTTIALVNLLGEQREP
jgi:hypothetical protein